jgi:hypothetical protein
MIVLVAFLVVAFVLAGIAEFVIIAAAALVFEFTDRRRRRRFARSFDWTMR